jgi:ABC-type sugar transport system substrate-binding protein
MAGGGVGLFLRTLKNDYQEQTREDFLATAPAHGFTVEIVNADNDADRQLRQIRDFIRRPGKRPLAIFVTPVRESGLLGAAYEAARLGVGWVVLNRSSDYLRELRDQFPKPPVFCVNPDQTQIGRIQGKQFKLLLPKGGELLYLRGPPTTSSAQKRWIGVEQEIEGSAIKMFTLNADWSGDGAEHATKKWLQGFRDRPLPNCIVGGQNDEMAVGAKKALREEAERTGRPEIRSIPVTGCDGSPRYGRRLVDEGEIAATVVIPPTAGRAIEELVSALGGKKILPVEVVLGVSSYPALEVLGSSNQPRRSLGA